MIEIKGHTAYKNLTAMQHDGFYKIFERFIGKINPERILEIGTASGGTTLALNDIMISLNKPNRIRSYEVNEHSWYNYLYDAGIDLRLKNVFNHAYDSLNEENVKEISEFIQSPGVTLVLCDGGHKIGEFNELSKYLKIGDYIMAHDYSESIEYYERHIKDKIWNWCEITEEDIKKASDDHNLKRYMAEEFQSIVWVCKVKE